MTTLETALSPAPASTRSLQSAIARRAPTVARCLLGVVFFVFGLNGFLNFIPPPPPGSMPEGALALSVALLHTGYLLQLVAGTQVLGGALLLANRFVPLALALLAPIVINIVAFHAFLAQSGLVLALVVVALELYLAWAYRAAFKPMLSSRTAAA
jgi:uncharacterized membrane protein YphA (DoxX/SURF4 family)